MRKRTIEDDPTVYRIRYSRAAQRLHLETPQGDGEAKSHEAESRAELGPEVDAAIAAVLAEISAKQGKADKDKKASALALDLISKTEAELLRLKRPYVGRTPSFLSRHLRRRNDPLDRRLATFLDQVLEPTTVVLYFSSLLLEEHGLELVLDALSRSPERLKRKKAHRDDRRKNLPPSQAWLALYLAHLVSPREPRPKGVRWLLALGFSRWRRPAPVNYRVHYNLACLYSRLAAHPQEIDKSNRERCLSEAANQLKMCLESVTGARRRAIVAWAPRDPGLRALQARKDPPLLRDILEPDESSQAPGPAPGRAD